MFLLLCLAAVVLVSVCHDALAVLAAARQFIGTAYTVAKWCGALVRDQDTGCTSDMAMVYCTQQN